MDNGPNRGGGRDQPATPEGSDPKQTKLTSGGTEIDMESADENEYLDELTDELFPDTDPIFANKSLLQISHIPDSNRIVGREKQISQVGNALADATRGEEPENLLIHGRTGTGKSLVSKYVTQLTQYKVDKSEDANITIGAAYIDCKTAKTEAKFAQVLGDVLNEREQTNITFPDHGLGYDTYMQRVWDVLDQLYDVAIIILDEIDKHKDSDSILASLSRAGEDEHITQCNLGLIIISNKSQWANRIEQRTDSGLQVEELVFSAYDEAQLAEIMRYRQDAFHDGVLNDDVIPLVAEYAAEEHGDARRALDILRNAGKLARKDDHSEVTVDHVHQAADHAEKEEVQDHLADEPKQSQMSLLALALLTQKTDDLGFTNDQIYRVYNALAERDSDANVLSERRIIDILDELTFLEIIQTEKSSGGYQRGSIALRRPVYDPKIIDEVICENEPDLVDPRNEVARGIYDYLIEK